MPVFVSSNSRNWLRQSLAHMVWFEQSEKNRMEIKQRSEESAAEMLPAPL